MGRVQRVSIEYLEQRSPPENSGRGRKCPPVALLWLRLCAHCLSVLILPSCLRCSALRRRPPGERSQTHDLLLSFTPQTILCAALNRGQVASTRRLLRCWYLSVVFGRVISTAWSSKPPVHPQNFTVETRTTRVSDGHFTRHVELDHGPPVPIRRRATSCDPRPIISLGQLT